MREFVEAELMPNCYEWDEAKSIPKDLFAKCYRAGFLPGVVGPPWPTQYAGSIVAGGLKPEQYDAFCELISTDEVSRTGSGGICWGLFGGLSIGLPPVMKFGSKFLQDKVCGPCLKGEKVICLAITEPYAGSDVANLQCEAKKTEDGKHYIVNGEKKWITNGVFADYFTVAVRTGGKGMGGVSMLLVERSAGVTTRQMQCQGVWASGTTYITFEDVKVPVENLIGKENQGFKYIMYNFNHERYVLGAATRMKHRSHKVWDDLQQSLQDLITEPVRMTGLSCISAEIDSELCHSYPIALSLFLHSDGVSRCRPVVSHESVSKKQCVIHSSVRHSANC